MSAFRKKTWQNVTYFIRNGKYRLMFSSYQALNSTRTDKNKDFQIILSYLHRMESRIFMNPFERNSSDGTRCQQTNIRVLQEVVTQPKFTFPYAP